MNLRYINLKPTQITKVQAQGPTSNWTRMNPFIKIQYSPEIENLDFAQNNPNNCGREFWPKRLKSKEYKKSKPNNIMEDNFQTKGLLELRWIYSNN